jgi:Phage portal protein, SPP1 Gp6-like
VTSYATAPPPRIEDRTALDWRELLLRRLAKQAADALVYEDYYDGKHQLQFATSKFQEAFGRMFSVFADNWCQIVVDAAVERLRVVGFQIGGQASDEAWTVWQRNGLDAESVVAHTEAGKSGQAFLLVDPNDGDPRITIEHSAQVVVATDPGDRRKRLAALKRWLGDDGFVYVTLYLPDIVLKFESKEPISDRYPLEWVARADAETNPLGVVPVIPLENKPGLLGGGHSDLEPALPLQSAVNKLCTDMIVASEYGAFPQRIITGVEVPKDPNTGKPLISIEAALSRLTMLGRPEARVWDLKAVELSNFVDAIEMYIQHLAAQTRTPPHYLLAKLVNTSGDALSVAEAGLVSKCRSKILFFSDPWEEAIALALGVEEADCEAIWANPERISQAQLTDAAVKKKTLGVPLPMIWLELGYTPEQIVEMEKSEADVEQAQLEATPPPGQEPAPAAPPQTGGQVNG